VLTAHACPPTQALGELPEALAHARAALALEPRDAALKRLARELEAAAVQSAYEAGLLHAASVALAGDAAAAAGAEAELQLPPGAAGALAEVLRTVNVAKRASSGAALEKEEAAAEADSKGLAASLPRLRELLRAAPRNRDLFAAAGGVAALLACYAEDNLGVLGALSDAVSGCDRGAAALAAAADDAQLHAQLLVHALRDRRLAVICAAADLLLAVAPASRAARTELCAAQYIETLVLMIARAPPPLAHRAVALLAALAAADAPAAAAALGAHAVVLCDALARMASPMAKGAAGGAPQRAAVSAAAALCRTSEALRRAMGGSPKLAAALLALLRADSGAAPEARRIDFSSGVSLVHRAWARAPPDAAAGLAATMSLAAALARGSGAWASHWDEEEDAWALLLPLLHAPPPLSAPAVRLLAACAAAEPRCSVALAELGVAEPVLSLLSSADAAACAHAAALLRCCADCGALHRELLRLGQEDAARGLPAACALLTARRASDAAVEALALTCVAAAQLEPGALRYMALTRTRFGHDVVRAWYERARAPPARDALEALLMALLSSDEGAAALAADADSEAHVTTLVADLRARRAAELMRATGGASVLNPAAVGLATPYASVVFGEGDSGAGAAAAATPEAAREAALARVDAAAPARYIGTLLPGCCAAAPPAGASSSATPRPVVVDTSGGGGALATRLARALPGAAVYAAERSRAAVDGCVARAAAAGVPNVTPVFCADGCGLDALPLPAHCVVAALCAAQLEEEPQAIALMANKLRAGGTLVLLEEEPEALAAAARAAHAAGLATVAQPDVLNAFFVHVLRVV
jgi:precorrin-6B methylase 2